MQAHIVELLSVMNSNFKKNVWKLKEIDGAIENITSDMKAACGEERGSWIYNQVQVGAQHHRQVRPQD